jgi:hypothetical protein
MYYRFMLAFCVQSRRALVCLLFLLLVLVPEFVQASFGITPPYVRNTSLTRNITYEQEILLVRGDPSVPLKAEVVVDAPEIASWIEIVQGTPIALPRGEQKVPMTVRVRVPSDAEFKDYEGVIRIRTVPDDSIVNSGAVNISLGAQVQINLSVIDKRIEDFRVRKVSLADLNEGRKLAWLYYPGKIRFDMLIENTGNVDISPSRVEFKIYDFSGNLLLEETDNLGDIPEVSPYDTRDVTAEIPTRLPAGNYFVRFGIYNGEDLKHGGELNMTILPYGTLDLAGFGFVGLSLMHKLSLLIPIFTLLIISLYVIYNARRRRLAR